MSPTSTVSAAVATVWTGPDAPRDVDAPAVAAEADLAAWMTALTPAARLGLHGRTLTQALAGEPAAVLEERGDWVQVALPWQPSPDPRGYVGWVRRAHLASGGTSGSPADPRGHAGEPTTDELLRLAREHVGLPYLWAGTSSFGLDCSGLVHHTYRRLGVIVPRDSPDQRAVATPVALDDVRPGDLYFFEHRGPRGDGRTYHVGIATTSADEGPRRMIHAPEGTPTDHGLLEEAALSPARERDLAAAGRITRSG